MVVSKYQKAQDVYFKGKASWVKAVAPNQWGKWSMTLHPDTESLERLREYQADGLKNHIKKDDDGYFVQLSRPVNKEMRGKLVAFEPPQVVDTEGKDIKGTAIGNGSDVTVKCEMYTFSPPTGGSGMAMRWKSLRVDNLIPFEPERDFTDGQKEQVRGLNEQPEQLF